MEEYILAISASKPFAYKAEEIGKKILLNAERKIVRVLTNDNATLYTPTSAAAAFKAPKKNVSTHPKLLVNIPEKNNGKEKKKNSL